MYKILYLENPKDSTRKLLELINEYSKVAGYKISTQISLAFLYTNNEKTEREIKETIPFTIATKSIKYLGIYLPKETCLILINLKLTHNLTHKVKCPFSDHRNHTTSVSLYSFQAILLFTCGNDYKIYILLVYILACQTLLKY